MEERIRQISNCMQILEECRNVGTYTAFDLLGELDTLTELHRLVHEPNHAAENVSRPGPSQGTTAAASPSSTSTAFSEE